MKHLSSAFLVLVLLVLILTSNTACAEKPDIPEKELTIYTIDNERAPWDYGD